MVMSASYAWRDFSSSTISRMECSERVEDGLALKGFKLQIPRDDQQLLGEQPRIVHVQIEVAGHASGAVVRQDREAEAIRRTVGVGTAEEVQVSGQADALARDFRDDDWNQSVVPI